MTSDGCSVARACALRAIMVLTIIWTCCGPGGPRVSAASRSRAQLVSAPLSFDPNQGQAGSTVQFVSHGSGYALLLSPGEVVLELEPQLTVRMSLLGANAKAQAAGLALQSGVVSYLIGNDPAKWRSGVPTYSKVRYAGIYPGVDLVFYGNQRQLEYDFVVAPGADPSRIAWRIDGARPGIDADGNLALNAPDGRASFKKPVLYQMDGNKRTSVEGSFAVTGNQVCFRVGRYDRSRALIIDPVLTYASYLAGSKSDTIGAPTGPGIAQVGTSQGIALDSMGSVYVAGTTFSIDFPMANPYQSAPPAKLVPPGQWASAFVSKFSPDGSSLVYSTYLGGNGADHAYAIAVDATGNAYVTGLTSSPNFPITNGAYQTVCAPIANNKGGAEAESNCNSSDYNVFVAKLNATGTGLVYSTFLGGYGNWSYATAIAVDGAGRAYVAGNETDICQTGYVFEACFPTTNGAVIGGDKPGGGSPQYAFAAVFDPTGAQLLYSTLFGDLNFNGGGGAYATGMAVDRNGYFYLIGETQAGQLPTTAGVIQPNRDPPGSLAWRGFVAKFNPVTSAGGASLAYATYLGGHTANTGDYISGITIDSGGNAYIAGYTNSSDFPVTSGAYGTVCGLGGTCSAAHVTKLNPSGSAILWSTYVGDSKQDGSDAVFFTGPIQLDGKGNIYIMGQVGFGFPMVNAVEPTPTGGSQQVLIAELDPTGANLLFSTTIGSDGLHTANPAGLAVDSTGNIYLAGNHIGPGLITTPGAFQMTANDSMCCYHGFVAKIAAGAGAGPKVALATAGQVEPFAAESIVSAYGTNLAGVTDWGTIPLPTSLDGNSVTVTDSAGVATPAPLFYISPSQINFEIPKGVAKGNATVMIRNQNGSAQSTSISIGSVSPGIFELNAAGLVAAWVLPVIAGAQQALQPVYQVVGGNVASLPVSLGASNEQVYLEIYGTGIRNAKTVTVTVGGVSVPVIYAGPAPGYAGEDQVNVGPMPRSLAGQGSVNIVLTADGQQANVVTITIE